MNQKTIFTTVSTYVARVGYSFKFLGASEECSICRIFKACLGRMEENSIYTIVSIGKNNLECKLIGEKAIVVKIKPALRIFGVSNKSAIIGTRFKIKEKESDRCCESCVCIPSSSDLEKKFVVRRVVKKNFSCALGSSRSLVEVEPS